MKLHEIERVDAKVFEAAVDPGGEVVAGVARHFLLRKALAGLGGDIGALAPAFAQGSGDQLLGASVAVDVRGVDEGDAVVERRMERIEGLLVFDVDPLGAANAPGAKADFADRAPGPANLARPLRHRRGRGGRARARVGGKISRFGGR